MDRERKIRNSGDRGVSIIGTLFTLIILGVMGAALVSLVATDQESRMKLIHRERAFYAMQAGLEWALREIKEGGYPVQTFKSLGTNATFTVAITPATRTITSQGASGPVVNTHSITTSQLGSDCLTIDVRHAAAGGAGNNELRGVTVTKTCLNAVSIDALTLSWSPNAAERVRAVSIGGVEVYNDATGTLSGTSTNITDKKITVSSDVAIDYIRLSASVVGKTFNLTLGLTDTSSVASSEMKNVR